MNFSFRVSIGAPPWVIALLVVGLGVFLFWSGSPVARWILLGTLIAELVAVVIYRFYPSAVEAVMAPLYAVPTEGEFLRMLIQGDGHELLRSLLVGVVVLACLFIIVGGGTLLFWWLGY